MNKTIQKLICMLLLITSSIFIWLQTDIVVSADEPVIIVIDPGHGGENQGAQYDGYTEKNMTMVVANAMKEELEQYENVVVYLTHDTDTNMTLKERAQFAKDRNADFLYSLHFNASVNHNLFGAEVWIPAFDNFYVKGYQFAEIQLQQFENIGLYSRGIKTKLNDEGEEYYGILRFCSAMDIPSALIEHCHMDQDNDKHFYQQSEEQWKEFGRMDAEAVAKYFGLSSGKKGVDYSEYPKVSVDIPDGAVAPDLTAPETANIEILSIDNTTGEATVRANASDGDSFILYYKYSFDGGITYSDLQEWPRPTWNKSEPEHTFNITVPFDKEIDLRVCFHNSFDVQAESNCITIDAIKSPEEKDDSPAVQNVYKEINIEVPAALSKSGLSRTDKVKLIVLILIISFFIWLILLAMVKMIIKIKPRNKRRKKR